MLKQSLEGFFSAKSPCSIAAADQNSSSTMQHLKFFEQSFYCFDSAQWFDFPLANHCQGSTTCWASQISGIQFPSDTTSFIYSTASASLNMSLVFMFFSSISRNIDWHVCSHALFLLSKTLVRKTLEYEYSSDCGHSAVDILHGGIPAGSCPRQVEQLQTSGPATSLQGCQASFA